MQAEGWPLIDRPFRQASAPVAAREALRKRRTGWRDSKDVEAFLREQRIALDHHVFLQTRLEFGND